jgi:very-short-patch-repair endonuclease
MGNSNWILRNMGEQGNTEYRREQVRCARILRDRLGNNAVRQEYTLRNLKIDGERAPNAILDLAIPKEKMAIRMMGKIHDKSKKVNLKDWYQREALIQEGWVVYDFHEDDFPNLWKPKRSHEVDQASKEEVLKALGFWDDPSIARASKV